MHGQQNDKYTEMHGQQNDKNTEMHGQQNVKKYPPLVRLPQKATELRFLENMDKVQSNTTCLVF